MARRDCRVDLQQESGGTDNGGQGGAREDGDLASAGRGDGAGRTGLAAGRGSASAGGSGGGSRDATSGLDGRVAGVAVARVAAGGDNSGRGDDRSVVGAGSGAVVVAAADPC